ncbi:hypothetical protein GEU84_004355 [Fertoebacter nigrum]|uniref:Uncharacterized protein n=1 Tax=Fertoeibacter niger TaxID=2656921 RepID=A0A8X8GZY9_9RHOB|nr:hypothetical protein [Fertoeibacter niger]NUB43607.1 hypothetical protein [Fertoeibacter niger]
MRNLGPADELAAIRAEIARLEARADTLRALLQTAAAPLSPTRPGWPIRRDAGQEGALH